MTRNTEGEQRSSNCRLYDSAGIPLLRARRKNAFARAILEIQTRGRKRRHGPGQEPENR